MLAIGALLTAAIIAGVSLLTPAGLSAAINLGGTFLLVYIVVAGLTAARLDIRKRNTEIYR